MRAEVKGKCAEAVRYLHIDMDNYYTDVVKFCLTTKFFIYILDAFNEKFLKRFLKQP